jgi:two-component system phosphate regulon sensor histidine kinase PhoR
MILAFVLAVCVCACACAVAVALDQRMPPASAVAIAAGAGGILLAVLICGLIQWRLIGPLSALVREARRVVEQDWRGRVRVAGSPEIRALADEFSRLAAETHRRLSGLEHQQADLHALVDTLPDPILASDSESRLILMNAPAGALLGLSAEQAIGQKVVSVVADEAVVQLFEAVADLPKPASTPAGATALPPAAAPIQREVRLLRGGQKLTCQAVAARTADGGALVVLRDVSTLARAIQMKTDFVANASHELRTPITAIKIAFETLREAFGDDPIQAEKCMGVIDGHLRRLEDMLRDLLDLSRVEGPEHEAAVAQVKSTDLFNAVRGALLPMARQKLVEIDFVDPGVDEFKSDARLLNLILKNLVENSIKYTPVGGKVTVTLTAGNGTGQAGSDVILKIADTGIGIAPEHIDRVFERFYQVDSARSGSAGRGTGLGLAIVKHATAALRGTVQLESTVGVGTTVTCIFPRSAEGDSSEIGPDAQEQSEGEEVQ